MIGEFIRDGKAHLISFDGAPPATVVLSMRASCPKSKPLEVTLEHVGLDLKRQVALYRIASEREKS